MKHLILVTTQEFNNDPEEIFGLCKDLCLASGQDVGLVIPSNTDSCAYVEIACAMPTLEGCKLVFNEKVIEKYGINLCTKLSKAATIIADIFEKEGIYGLIGPEVERRLAKAAGEIARSLINLKAYEIL